jgi:CBS domain-containing protein
MKLAELLSQKRIVLPLEAESLEEGVRRVLHQMQLTPAGGVSLDGFSESDLRKPSPRTLLVVERGGEGAVAGLGISPEPLPGEGGEAVRIILIIHAGRRSRIREEALDALLDLLADPEVESALLTADSKATVLGLSRLMGFRLAGEMRVGDYMTPLSYRIFPDTPIGEVADLMARKSLAAVPVVGKGLEVLGIITSGEALKHTLAGRGGGSSQTTLARDVMSRSVLCVTEDQNLNDAATMMSNRDLAQMPVVREGEIVGFLTREAVLRALLSD